jgi:hypothetical protein
MAAAPDIIPESKDAVFINYNSLYIRYKWNQLSFMKNTQQ